MRKIIGVLLSVLTCFSLMTESINVIHAISEKNQIIEDDSDLLNGKYNDVFENEEDSYISFNSQSITIEEGESYQLFAEVHPNNAFDQKINWVSKNEQMVSVDENGYIIAKSIGTTSIIASLQNGRYAECQIKVIRDINKCTINSIPNQIYTGKEIKPEVIVKYGDQLLKKDIDYSLAYKNNINVGTATIIISGKGNYSGILRKNFKIQILPNSIKLAKSSVTLNKGKTYTFVLTITPNNATNKKVTYTTSNSKVATVTSNGKVKAVNCGTAVITAKTSNGKTATCKVTVPYTVKYNLNGGTNNKSNPTSYYGKKITLKNPTRKGYSFAGWYSDSKYKTKVTSFSSGNKNLYAKWNKVTVGKNNIRLSKVGSNKIKISYNAVSGVKGYQIQYSSNASFTSSKTQKTNALSYTTSSLTKGKTYYARVRGYKMDSVGSMVYGKWSNIKSLYIAKPVVQPKPSTSVSSMVYISKTGSKYHSNLNCSNMKNPSHISINEAKRRGLGPCSKCYK